MEGRGEVPMAVCPIVEPYTGYMAPKASLKIWQFLSICPSHLKKVTELGFYEGAIALPLPTRFFPAKSCQAKVNSTSLKPYHSGKINIHTNNIYVNR